MCEDDKVIYENCKGHLGFILEVIDHLVQNDAYYNMGQPIDKVYHTKSSKNYKK